MINENFIFLGAAFSLAGCLKYVVETIRGNAKPNRVTWLLWGVVPMIAFASEISQGVGLPSLLTFMVGFGPLLVFAASFVNKQAEWKLGRFDIVCGALSVLGVVLWLTTDSPNLAIVFSIAADLLAALPTLVKAYRFPETENGMAFLGGAANGAITLLALQEWTFAHYAFPLYIFLLSGSLFLLIQFRLGPRLATQR
jgi:hypothetical protein